MAAIAAIMRVYLLGLLGHALVGALSRPFFSAARPTWYPAAATAGGLLSTAALAAVAVGPRGAAGYSRSGRPAAGAAGRTVGAAADPALACSRRSRRREHGRSDLDLVGHRFVGAYLVGFEPGLRRQVDVAVMMAAQALDLAERRQRPVLSLLRGSEPYETRFRPVAIRNQRLLLARRGRPGTATGDAWPVRARTALADATGDRLPRLHRTRHRTRQPAARLPARWR
jgi:hypothetical protein